MPSIALLSLLALLLAAPPARGDPWLRPVDGDLLRAFAVGANPYARGQHRGIDLRAARGSRVRSACAGRVSFAGRVPGGGATVSVRCGGLVATYQQMAAIGVRRGQHVARGEPLGVAGRSEDAHVRMPHVHLGARDATTGRYVDPLTLLGAARPPVALPPAVPVGPRALPPARAPLRAPLRAPPPRSIPALEPAPIPTATVPAHDPGVPWFVWVGLASVGLALPIEEFVRLRHRRRVAAAARPATTSTA